MIGTCRFCGQMKEVRAADQSAADEMTSRSCDCAASGDYARRIATTEAVEEICENYELTGEQVTVLQALALSVDDGAVTKANVTMGGLKISCGIKNNGNTFVKISKSKEETREITREGVK